MQEQIIQFFQNISAADYFIMGISLGFFIVFIFSGIDKIYKAYLGLILGLFLFSIINLTIGAFNPLDGEESMRSYFYNHREWIWFYSIFLIPILGILIPFNKNITFRVSSNKILNYLTIFAFWLFLFSFILSIFLSILNNRFLFLLDNSLINELQNSALITSLYAYFQESKIFLFLFRYDSMINLCIIVFIFYKMTIGGIVDFFMAKLFWLLEKMFEKKAHEDEAHDHESDHGHWHRHG